MLKLNMYKIKIPSDISVICTTVSDMLNYIMDIYGEISDDIQFEIKVILNELILNAIKHGNKEDTDKNVKIAAAVIKSEYVYFLIEDEGQGYDYKCLLQCIKDPQKLVNCCEMKETGRGILIVANLCDQVRFNKKGNRIAVVKKLCRA